MLLLSLVSLLLGGVTVTLSPEARVNGTAFELGQVAAITGDDPSEVAQVAAFGLGYVPAPGHTRLLRAEILQQDLTRRFPGLGITFEGSIASRVHPEVAIVPAAEIEKAAQAELGRHIENLDARARLVQPVPDVQIPAGTAPYKLQSVIARRDAVAGRVSVPVRIVVDGEIIRTAWTRWQVEVFAERTVLARGVRAGEVITADMLTKTRAPVESGRTVEPLDTARLVGAVASRDVAAGSVISDGDVIRPTLVKRGDTLFLEVKKGAVRAKVPALAAENGSIGDRIKVTIVSSQREMQAIVISRDLARIDLTPSKG